MPCTRCRRHTFVGSETPCSRARAAAGHIFERVEETWNAGDVQAQSEVYAADPGYVKRQTGCSTWPKRRIVRIPRRSLVSTAFRS